MEDNYKIRVGITHGDINGVGYEVILKTFSDPTMLELCTPIIYGSPKVAAYHRKAMDIQTNFSIVNSADDAQPASTRPARGCNSAVWKMRWPCLPALWEPLISSMMPDKST